MSCNIKPRLWYHTADPPPQIHNINKLCIFIDVINLPGRAEELISLILGEKVKILHVLPLESPRIGGEHSLIVMDLVVKLENGSIVNIEVQRPGYRFPGQRSACYSADLLLRQYKESTSEFHHFPDHYIHYFSQQSNTGINISTVSQILRRNLYAMPGRKRLMRKRRPLKLGNRKSGN